jgi:beta propeller repeat protein
MPTPQALSFNKVRHVLLITAFIGTALPNIASAAPSAQLVARPVAQAAAPQASAPFVLAQGAGNQVWPSMAGNVMVYSDCKGSNCEIMSMDLATRKATLVKQTAWPEQQPDTDGTYVVWSDGAVGSSTSLDDRLNDYNVAGQHLFSKKELAVTSAPRLQVRPKVWGNVVVWSDYRDAKSKGDQEAGDIYMYDLSTGNETLVSRARSAQTRPVTNGRYIVWVDYRNEPDPNGNNSDLYAYDIATKQEFVIANAPDTQTEPAISGNILVWSDFRKGAEFDADLYGFDLATRKEFLIAGAAGTQANPGISGNIVVWEDYRNEPDKERGVNSDIYGYDLVAKREFPIYVGPGAQGAPRITGNTVAWEDNLGDLKTGDWNIKGATLSGIALTPPPIPLPGTGSTTFPQTAKTVSGIFLDYWNKNGGLAQQGYPITQVMGEISDLDGKLYTVQYFERAVFEYHPEIADPKFKVLLSQLATFQYRKKYPSGAPDQRANTSAGTLLFPETGKHLGGIFLKYWNEHGGLPQQGYPISEEFTEISDLNGKPYLVQYFERAVFEYHPEEKPEFQVLLSQLGTFQARAKYSTP